MSNRIKYIRTDDLAKTPLRKSVPTSDINANTAARHTHSNKSVLNDEALTRYANELTGANDTDLISAAETLITDRIKED